MRNNMPVYTIGYSPHTVESFIATLNKYGIQAVCDVRSQPYSKYKPEFSQAALKAVLKNKNIHYVFLGKELGARREEPECYVDGQVDFGKVPETSLFKKGIERLAEGMRNYTVVLLCAEKDPICCHRAVLVARQLYLKGVKVLHILEDGSLEPHENLERRLLALHGRGQAELFTDPKDLIKEAYDLQAKAIAFSVREGDD